MKSLLCFSVAVTCAWIHAVPAISATQLEAFPGAVGYGKHAEGGRQGRMMFVTSLADSGSGTLRACVEAEGPRNCIFRMGGIIRLQSPLGIEGPRGHLSILGQTAPDPGVTLSIGAENLSYIKTPLFVRNAEHVVIRHIRVRLQYEAAVPNADTLTVEDSKHVYIDHVSGSWATDEIFSTHLNATELTVANSLFAEGLLPHSKCALLGSDPSAPQNMTFWRNGCLSNNDRNPDVNHFAGSCIDVVNNVFYNSRSEWVEVFSQFTGGTPVSVVGNYFKAGRNTLPSTYMLKWQSNNSVSPPRIYSRDNVTWAPEDKTIEPLSPDAAKAVSAEPICPMSVPVDDANSAYKIVRGQSGAFPRDAVDNRLMKELGDRGKGGRGVLLKEHGELPQQQDSAMPYADMDDDGIADSLETRLGAQPGQFDPWIKSASSDWPVFDEFMEWLAQERIEGRYPQ
jgi:pectate lyase